MHYFNNYYVMHGAKGPQVAEILNNVFVWAYEYVIRNAVYEFI